MKRALQVTHPALPPLKSEALEADDPEDGSEAGHCKAVHQHSGQVLDPNEAAAEQGEPRKGHQKTQDGANIKAVSPVLTAAVSAATPS